MEHLINEEIVKEYMSFDELMRLAEDIPQCPNEEYPHAGALAKASLQRSTLSLELD